MGIFNSTFRQHIIDELNFRKTHEGRQQVYHPTARVTALIGSSGGKIKNTTIPQLRGFTLGVPETSLISKLEEITNINNDMVTVGITYIGGTPAPVKISTKKNLPSPGVTNITIATQSKGGLVFKATVNFKFYGKEQYDFIYQTFMRPGNPIIIEFGHTRTEKTLTDLNFFRDLEDIQPYILDIKQVSKLQATRTSGVVCGLVSNFKISLNENNEYDASIDIINALEFLFTLPPEDTILNFKTTGLSDSIKNNFGYEEGEEYDPSLDRIFQLVNDDLVYEQLAFSENNGGNSVIVQYPYKEHILDNRIKRDIEMYPDSLRSLVGDKILENPPSNLLPMNSNFTYISLEYICNRLLPHILKTTVVSQFGIEDV